MKPDRHGPHRQIAGRVLIHLVLLLSLAATAPADISTLPPKAARKEKAPPEPVPPEAVPVNVTVRRGGTVEIPLRVFGVPGERFTYRLRSLPTAGKLSQPKMVGRSIGMVTYEQRGESGPDHDQFRFATQTGHGVSAAVAVNITILDDPPALNVTGDFDFGTVTIGSSVTHELTIENRGGGVLKGTLTVTEPWALEGRDTYHLRAGEHQTVSVRFSPQNEDSHLGHLRFSSQPENSTTLQGVAEAVVAIEPRRLELQPGADTARTGVLTIVNRTAEEQPVRLRIGAKLSGPDRVIVPAQGRATVAISTPPGVLAPVDEVIEIFAASFAAKIPVHAPAAGPIVSVNPAALNFGKITSDRASAASLLLTNSGGTRASVQLDAASPATVAGADTTFWLEPGTVREIGVSLAGASAGTVRTQIRIVASGVETIVPVVAEVTRGTEPPKPRPAARAKIADAVDFDPAAKPQIEARIRRVTPTTCEIEWKAAGRSLQYQVAELGTAMTVRGEPHPAWLPMANVKIQNTGGDAIKNLTAHGVKVEEWNTAPESVSPTDPDAATAMVAVLEQLKRESLHEVRVQAIDAYGKTIQISYPLTFRTPVWWRQAALLKTLAGASVLLLFLGIRRWLSGGVSPAPAKVEEESEPAVPQEWMAGQSPVALAKPPGAPAVPAAKKFTMRELEPGRHEINLGE